MYPPNKSFHNPCIPSLQKFGKTSKTLPSDFSSVRIYGYSYLTVLVLVTCHFKLLHSKKYFIINCTFCLNIKVFENKTNNYLMAVLFTLKVFNSKILITLSLFCLHLKCSAEKQTII